jgi:dipeptidyl aminopeptidase/acylaminoacyl peptidase
VAASDRISEHLGEDLRMLGRFAVVAVLIGVAAFPAREASATIHEYKFLDIAPNGSLLAAVEPVAVSDSETEPRGPVVVRRSEDGRVVGRVDPCPRCRYTGLAWSPDGKRLAFLATDDRAEMVRIDVALAGASANLKAIPIRTLATFKGVGGTLRWSPDGSQLALLATVNAKKLAGALEAGAPQVGEIGEEPDKQRIAVVPINGGPIRLVSPVDLYVYEYDWVPDGSGFVATAAHGNGDENWWVAELLLIELGSGHTHSIAHPDRQIAMPRVSPDGKNVVFIGGLMSDFGTVGGDVYEVPIKGGTPVNRTPGFRGSFWSLAYRAGRLYATALVVDRGTLLRFDDTSQEPQTVWSKAAGLSTGDDAAGDVDPTVVLSADGEYAATVAEEFGRGPAVLAGPIKAMRQITTDNDATQEQLNVTSVTWMNDGYNIQGWLVGPTERKPGKRYPLIVQVHGGPSWATSPYFGRDNDFETATREWAARGYYVFLPNPRGSFGQGEVFTRANVRDFGGGDFRDILAGVDAVLKSAPIDETRVGIYGHSYGGFMTMWSVAHTQRFKAAIAGAGIANWISYYGENGINQWMIPFFGASAYDDPAIYRAASPLESIASARTPTFLYVGELDIECPAPQSFEYWRALKAKGITTQLMVYPGSGHSIHKPAQVRDLKRREAAWFDRYLSP